MAAFQVSVAAKRLEYLLDTGNEALEGVRAELNEGQCELKGMLSKLREAATKYNHDPTVNRLLSVIKGYAWNIEDAIDPEFLKVMIRRRSVFKRMVLVFCCCVDESESRIMYVLKNIGGIRDAYLALGFKYKL